MSLERVFGKPKVLIGVVHLEPLPGSPGYGGSLSDVIEAARKDARALEEGGMDGAIVENFGDTPFHPERVPPETVAAMAVAATELRRAVHLPLGVNVLRNDARSAVALCAACGLGFFRVNVHAGASVSDQGLLHGRAHETLRARDALWTVAAQPPPLLFADVEVKHARSLGAGPLEQAAEDLFRRGRADVLLLTGSGTGKEASFEEVGRVRAAVPEAPVLVASGITHRTAGRALVEADGAIVGTWLKRDGRVQERVDPERVRALVAAAGV